MGQHGLGRYCLLAFNINRLNTTNMDKEKIKQFRGDFDKAVEALADRYSVSIDLGNIRYDAHQFTSKITVTEIAEGVDPEDAKWIESLRKYGYVYGLDEDSYGAKLSRGGEIFDIVGIKPRATKYPIVARKRSDGKLYKLQPDAVRNLQAG